jgi:hypothetical protein
VVIYKAAKPQIAKWFYNKLAHVKESLFYNNLIVINEIQKATLVNANVAFVV